MYTRVLVYYIVVLIAVDTYTCCDVHASVGALTSHVSACMRRARRPARGSMATAAPPHACDAASARLDPYS